MESMKAGLIFFDDDNALAYKFMEVRFVRFVPPWRFFN
jgi:hypothetical protein